MRGDLKGADCRRFDRLLTLGTVAGLSDGELLGRFAKRSDEAAFEALAARHGPMVLGVCRRILDDGHAAEDAFQATFLILVKRSRSLRDGDRLGPWLHGVARRVALRARQREVRRRNVERTGVEAATFEAPEADRGRDERLALLDEEIARMPERFRLPLILCYLEGLTHEEAADRLGCPLGTVRSRIARARDSLRNRLARHGLMVPSGLLAEGSVGSPPIPPGLFDATSRAALCVASGREVLAAGVSPSVAILAQEVLRMMSFSRWKTLVLALSVLGATVGVSALALGQKREPGQVPEPAVASKVPKLATPVAAKDEPPSELRGVVLDSGGQPLADALIVAGSADLGRSGHQILRTDGQGRFAWKLPVGTKEVGLVASKQGFAPAVLKAYSPGLPEPHDLKLRLAKSEPFVATLVDGEGKPVVGARITVESIASGSESKEGGKTLVTTCFTHVAQLTIAASPVEDLFVATTDLDGSFTFPELPMGSGLKLKATTADGRSMRVETSAGEFDHVRQSMHHQGYATAPRGESTRLKAIPVARIVGRVVSKLPGVGVNRLTAAYQVSRTGTDYRPSINDHGSVLTDADGRFVLDGLGEGTVNVFVHGDGENEDWTYRAADDVKLVPGVASEVTIELIRGVEVEGTVVVRGTNRPIEGAKVGIHGPFRPRSGAATTGSKTDAQGRYHYRVPSGETYFYIMGPPSGFARILSGPGSSSTVIIPEGSAKFEVPPLELEPAVTIRGRVLDAAGLPIAKATVVGTCDGGILPPVPRSQNHD